MASVKSTIDIIKDLLEGVDWSAQINEVIDEGGGIYTILVCDTLYATPCPDPLVSRPIRINGEEYQVLEVINATSLKIQGNTTPPATRFEMNPPFFKHGTPQQVANELIAENDWRNKMPLFWLLEVYKDSNDRRPDAVTLRTSDLLFFALDNCNLEDWTASEHHQYVIGPMQNMIETIYQSFIDQEAILPIDKDETMPHTNFGIYVKNRGHEVDLFNDIVSGVEWRVSLPFRDIAKCKC